MYIEIIQKNKNQLPKQSLIEMAVDYLNSLTLNFDCGSCSINTFENSLELRNIVEKIVVYSDIQKIIYPDSSNIYCYQLNEDEGDYDFFMDGNKSLSDVTNSAIHWILPSREFDGIFEHLTYDENLKENLYIFIETIILFSIKNINTNIITCNKLVLLHGPPGTGKTSLCKALAQKISIRMQDKFKFTHFVEINSHSLFSKWYSESGKLIMNLFDRIKDLLDDRDSLVCVLIDEVESLAFARNAISNGEPTDSIRVVNTILTQLDQLRKYQNVLIFTTSNLPSTIDIAFLDRADIKQFIGNPSVDAIYKIYCSSLNELIRTKIIVDDNVSLDSHKYKITELAKLSNGLSGRSLRKIPFLAHMYLADRTQMSIANYLNAMEVAILKFMIDLNSLKIN